MPSVDSPIPFIDFAEFGDGTGPVRPLSPQALTMQEAERIGKQFYAACRDVGFAYLINTGFPQSMVDRMFEMSKAFFALPQEVKMTAPHPPQGDQHRYVHAVVQENDVTGGTLVSGLNRSHRWYLMKRNWRL